MQCASNLVNGSSHCAPGITAIAPQRNRSKLTRDRSRLFRLRSPFQRSNLRRELARSTSGRLVRSILGGLPWFVCRACKYLKRLCVPRLPAVERNRHLDFPHLSRSTLQPIRRQFSHHEHAHGEVTDSGVPYHSAVAEVLAVRNCLHRQACS